MSKPAPIAIDLDAATLEELDRIVSQASPLGCDRAEVLRAAIGIGLSVIADEADRMCAELGAEPGEVPASD